jgi:hypothetical protein
MIGKIFVTSTGYDPEKGKDVKDPYLGPNPSLGACRPDIRRKLKEGDQIFVVSGKVPNVAQFVIGGLEIAEKIDVLEAYRRFPEQRLRMGDDGQVMGNIIVDASGKQHKLDHHKTDTFDERVKNYVVGCNPIVLTTPEEVAAGRRLTLAILQDVFGIKGNSVRDIIGRARNMTEKQVLRLRTLLAAVKDSVPQPKELLLGLASAARVGG